MQACSCKFLFYFDCSVDIEMVHSVDCHSFMLVIYILVNLHDSKLILTRFKNKLQTKKYFLSLKPNFDTWSILYSTVVNREPDSKMLTSLLSRFNPKVSVGTG